MKICVTLFLVLISEICSYAQDSSTLLVVVNRNAKVVLDGEELGHVTKDKPFKFFVKSGEHYLQVICLCPEQIEESEILHLEEGIQRVLKIEFKSTQIPINKNQLLVAEFDFVIPGLFANTGNEKSIEYPTYYYAFEKGDELVIDLQMSNDNGTNVIEVYTYPDQNLLYTKDNFQDLTNQKISIKERGIYIIRFSTNHAFGRDVRLKLSRIPKSTEAVDFNTSVVWKEVYSTKVIHQPQNFFINGGTKATFSDGKSRVSLPIILPENSVKWYYEFTAERDEAENNQTEKLLNLASDLSYLVDQTGSLNFGIDQLTQPPGGDYCDIYLIDHDNTRNFLSKLEFLHYPVGTRENFKSGIVEINSAWDISISLGIKNPSAFYGINVAIEVVAIIKEDTLVMLHVD